MTTVTKTMPVLCMAQMTDTATVQTIPMNSYRVRNSKIIHNYIYNDVVLSHYIDVNFINMWRYCMGIYNKQLHVAIHFIINIAIAV